MLRDAAHGAETEEGRVHVEAEEATFCCFMYYITVVIITC